MITDNNNNNIPPHTTNELPDSKKQLTEENTTTSDPASNPVATISEQPNHNNGNAKQIIDENTAINHNDEVIDMTVDYEEEEEDDDDDEEEEDDDDDDDEDLDEDIQITGQQQVAVGKNSKNTYPLANDFNHLASKLMKPIPDYPVKDDAHYVWEIKDWNAILKEDKVRSPRFKCGDFEWNILLFPRGNTHNNMISIYMEPHPPLDEHEKPLDENWYVCAQFGLDIWNPQHPDAHLPSQSHHRFSKNETDWGFSSLIEARQLSSVKNPRNQSTTHAILENNQLNITGYVRVIDDSSTGVLWHSLIDYDSKKNAKLVYEIPTDSKSSDVALSLQKIFYLLSSSNDPVGTLELTKSFGWDSSDAFTQHDVQELNRILMDKLETAMKGSSIEGALNDIFVGKMKSYIKCVNVPYESSRVEDFWDIQLNVRGFKNLEQSFQNYIEIEMLEGENKYQAGDEHGYQDAKKGVVFESFPPVLHLQLKRFEYDFMVDDLVKIDDFYEFPDKIDLKPYLDEDLPDDVKNQNWNYKLHGVLVHQGSISNGHYYAMIKPNSHDNTWLRFDDDKVWKVTDTQVFQENYGAADLTQTQLSQMTRAEQQDHMVRRVTSAYMLVYYREVDLEKILPHDDKIINSAIPEHIPKQIAFEIEEHDRLEKARQEALYYTNAKLITTSTFNGQVGFDLALDPTNAKFYDEEWENTACDPTSLKVKKDSKFSSFIEEVGTNFNLNGTDFRLGAVCHRNNQTTRLDVPVSDQWKTATVMDVYFKVFNRKYDELLFYVEELNKDIKNLIQLVDIEEIEPKDFTFEKVFSTIESVGGKTSDVMKFENTDEYSNNLTIFIKYFDPISQEIRGLSHITVAKSDKVGSIVAPVKKLLGFKDDVEVELFEEVSPSKIDKIDIELTFDKHELSSGDIITFQVANPSLLNPSGTFRDAKSYYQFMYSRVHINVRPFKAEIDEEDSDYLAEETNGKDNVVDEDYIVVDEKNDAAAVDDDDKITNEEIQIAKKLSKTFSLWISSEYNYQDLASKIAAHLNCDPSYLRLFILNAQGARYPVRSSHHMSQFFPKVVPANSIIDFEYEILNIPLKDYENLKAVKVHWLSTLLQYQVFEVLVPKNGTIRDVVVKLLHKVNVAEKDLPHIFIWSGVKHKYYELFKFDTPLKVLDETIDLYCGVFPAEVEILTKHDMYKRFVDKEINPDDIDEPGKEEYVVAKQTSDSLNILPAFHFNRKSDIHHSH
ncbi:Ubiquitin carboxyl-terminal hydrolase [Candida maltosa Xu316]|uniref:ubiquitinyl hydrolase 1 n=1 Tax=Candida maltosa (strain Xu316) TaxID=1245528 RepID=M3K249_CANMX|nr:Ubiquitin carboxyl-terminal hydrolase [Candida maltosa Xu316]